MTSNLISAWLSQIAVGIVLTATILLCLRRKRIPPLPPGPTPIPIIGNLFDVPREHLGREFGQLAKTFGDVVHLNVLGRSTIVLGSSKAAYDLLDKRSANYSHRPASVMISLVGYDWLFALMNAGDRWRQHRRAVHPALKPDAVQEYQPIQSRVAHLFVQNILHSPQDLSLHIQFTFVAIILDIVYGIEIRGENDKYFAMVQQMADVGEAILVPGKFPVEAFPILRYLPSWLPGCDFQKFAADSKRDIAYTIDYLFNASMTSDASRSSVISRILEASEDKGAEVKKMCKEIGGTLYVAGADTTVATMQAFFLAMVLYPKAQEAAQKELDAVVGSDRLPGFSDRPSLPYLNALVKELLRWHPATQIGVPHKVLADDEYNGYLIPGGATVFVNIWAILRDPEVYPDPEEFKPERFLNSHGEFDVGAHDPAEIAFGFGRRVCPGQHLAHSMLFILCACVLAAFKIDPPIDESGTYQVIKREATDESVVSHPKVHQYTIRPRSSKLQELV